MLAGKSSAENGKEGIVLSVPDIGVVCSAEAAPTMCSRGGGCTAGEEPPRGPFPVPHNRSRGPMVLSRRGKKNTTS